ncbi:uncharacterized protein LOC123989069 [Osmia bicornis bicornis]|uniref:uncharacterized protein LOC123989069 n=1 Tax=Osmia bicornis bicornis TaxID=1437191 RepID=UPI001EAEE070|nr:uncharacterized protein LOC123989069 [Osmia bicornis bicornis]
MTEWYVSEGLSLAHQKTEAIMLTARKIPKPLTFKCGDSDITVQEKALNYASALSLLMPNAYSAGNLPRRLYYRVVEAVIMYAAPIWGTSLVFKGNVDLINGMQRTALLRVARAYCTTSADALCVITGHIPLDLLVGERMRLFEKRSKNPNKALNDRDKEEERKNTMARWQEHWGSSMKGRWTYRLIPNIGEWYNWGPGLLDYHLTQALIGHGCFGMYLKKFKKQESADCWFCPGITDDPEHTIF